jgi:hypothetical protein
VIYIFPGSDRLFGCSKIGSPILGIYSISRSQIHECGNWETEHYNFFVGINKAAQFLGIQKLEPDIYTVFDSHFSLAVRLSHINLKIQSDKFSLTDLELLLIERFGEGQKPEADGLHLPGQGHVVLPDHHRPSLTVLPAQQIE